MTEIGGKVAALTGPMVKPKLIENDTLVMPPSFADLGEEAEKSVKAGVRGSALAAAGSPSANGGSRASASARDERPWHILVTRREQRDIAIGVQEALAAMGYLEPQDEFVGYLGSGTRKAIRAFEKDHGLRPRGVFNERIATKIYEKAGKGPLPDAYLFLRRGFSQVRNVPVQLRDPKKPLGTHLFTYVYSAERGEPGWVGISLEGEDSEKVLDRITIPDDMRDEIAKGLTSGASFIVADVSKHSSVLPEGDDFIVRTNDSAKSVGVAKKPSARKRKRASTRRAAPPKKRVVRAQPQRKKVRRSVSGRRGFRPFRRR
jgi:peptidoglycan hydrolase-like protein with peptidoglycan-binding domain